MTDCIFCKIANNEIPSKKIWESNNLFCILDIEPVSKGHCLIITKKHFETLTDVPDEILSQILVEVKKTMNLLKEKLNVNNFNILQNNGKLAGQEVNHFHTHIIPIFKDDNAHIICGKSTSKESQNIEEIYEKIIKN